MLTNKTKFDFTVIFSIFSVILISYIFYIFYSGFGSGDDISEVLNAQNNTLYELIKNRLEGGSGARPVSVIINSLIHNFYESNVKLYTLSCTLTWLITILFISFSLTRFLNKSSVYIFVLLGSFPYFTTSVFAGPYLFSAYFASILFWSISLFFIIKFTEDKRNIFYFLGLLFLIFSLLTLEYIFPLLFLTSFLPIIYEISKMNKINKNILTNLFIIYILPIIIIIFLFFIFKIYLVQFYSNINYSYGVAPITIKSFIQAFYFYFVILIEVPLMLIEVIPYIFKIKFIIIAFLLVVIFFVLKKITNTQDIEKNIFKNQKTKNYFILIVISSLLSSSLIFLISFYPSSTFGYYNKMLVPGFISFSILISLLVNYLNLFRYSFIPIIISFLWISSMNIQLDNFTKSWKIRTKIVDDITLKINNIEFNDSSLLIANVPYFLNRNYNNESVFFTTWHLNAHLKLAEPLTIKSWPICYRILNERSFYPNHNIINKIDRISNEINVFYYEYEEGKESSKFEYLGNKSDMIEKLKEVKKNKINNHPIILREKIRLSLKRYYLKNLVF